MNIKKQYSEIHALLEANSNKRVSTIMPQLLELMTAKQANCNFIRNDEGQVTHVYCYYHKQWEDVSVAEYGKKTNAASGLASMCKEGVKSWNRQQSQLKSLKDVALSKVLAGELKADEVNDYLEAEERTIRTIVPREDGHIAEI